MPATIVVTRNVEARYRGFLSSVMLEIAPGVYVSPDLSSGVRERVWNVLEDWYRKLNNGAIVMMWRDKNACGSLSFCNLGYPPKEIIEADGILLIKRK